MRGAGRTGGTKSHPDSYRLSSNTVVFPCVKTFSSDSRERTLWKGENVVKGGKLTLKGDFRPFSEKTNSQKSQQLPGVVRRAWTEDPLLKT